MRHDIYTLPEITFVAGQSLTLRWKLWTINKTPFNTEGCVGDFSVVNYSDKTGDPLIVKSLTFSVGDDVTMTKNLASVDLLPKETLGLYGKYIYQITIKDVDGEAEIPNQGIMFIAHNIHESFLK